MEIIYTISMGQGVEYMSGDTIGWVIVAAVIFGSIMMSRGGGKNKKE